MIFLTSNLGGGEITRNDDGRHGVCAAWEQTGRSILDGKVERTAQEAARRKFSPEFMNRLDKVVVFHPLRHVQLEQILDIELGMVQRRVLDTARGQFLFRVTPAARAFLLREGTDLKYGARHLKRAIERNVVYPLANLLATEQVRLGDILCIDWDEESERLVFEKEGEGAVLPVAGYSGSRGEFRCGGCDWRETGRTSVQNDRSGNSGSVVAAQRVASGARGSPEKRHLALAQHAAFFGRSSSRIWPANALFLAAPFNDPPAPALLTTGLTLATQSAALGELFGFQRSTGLRAAPTSSSRPTRVECGAVFTSSGSLAASSAMERMASMNRSHSSFDSDSVGSIISAPGTIKGNAVV